MEDRGDSGVVGQTKFAKVKFAETKFAEVKFAETKFAETKFADRNVYVHTLALARRHPARGGRWR